MSPQFLISINVSCSSDKSCEIVILFSDWRRDGLLSNIFQKKSKMC